MNFPPTGNPFTEGELEDQQSDTWFKVARSILDHPIWLDCPTSWLRVWLVLLASANWAPRQRRFGADEITVQPGQVICSVDWLKLKSKASTKQVRDALKYLSGADSSFYVDETVKNPTCQKRASAITIQTASHGTLITIRNWERYQGREWYEGQAKQQAKGQTKGKPRANQGQTEGNASRSVEGIEQSTPSDSSGKPPEESSAGFALQPTSDNGAKPKPEKRPKNLRRGNPGWPEWKWNAWRELFMADPIRQKASGAKDDFGRRVLTVEDAQWITEAHARSNRKDLDPNSNFSGCFNGWLKTALDAREMDIAVEKFIGNPASESGYAHVPMEEVF